MNCISIVATSVVEDALILRNVPCNDCEKKTKINIQLLSSDCHSMSAFLAIKRNFPLVLTNICSYTIVQMDKAFFQTTFRSKYPDQ